MPELCCLLTDTQVGPKTAALKCMWMVLYFRGCRLMLHWTVLMEKGQMSVL